MTLQMESLTQPNLMPHKLTAQGKQWATDNAPELTDLASEIDNIAIDNTEQLIEWIESQPLPNQRWLAQQIS